MDSADLPDRLRAIVDRELAAGETIRWIDQPDPGRMGCFVWPMVLFGIFWTGILLVGPIGFGATMFGQGGMPGPGGGEFAIFGICFGLFMIPFFAVGIGMLTAPVWMRQWARSTVYLITDRRAVILNAWWNVNVRSFNPKSLTEFRRTERADGYGNVIFQRNNYIDSDGDRRTRDTGFYAIANPKDVEDMLRDLARTGPNTP